MTPYRKLEKLRRYWRWRFAAQDRLPLWWHVGRPNFGDDLNPELFEVLSGQQFRFEVDRNAPHILGMGSILEMAAPSSVVCGSGFLQAPRGMAPTPRRLVAVRGALSRAAFETGDHVILGDPAVLISEVITRPEEKRYRFGLIPHIRSVDSWNARNSKRLKLIHPGQSPWDIVREIAQCEIVLSQSLHGLIIADALDTPNVWVAPSETMVGGRFKFDDYFTTIDQAKEMVPDSAELFDRPSVFDATLSRYRFSKTRYRSALAAAAEALRVELNDSLRQAGSRSAGYRKRLGPSACLPE